MALAFPLRSQNRMNGNSLFRTRFLPRPQRQSGMASSHPARARVTLFLLPSCLLLAAVMVFPLAYAFYISFFNYNVGSGIATFVGLGNYASLLLEARLWNSTIRTLLIAMASVGLETIVGLIIAFGLYRLRRGARLLLILMFLPNIITPVASALFLKWIFTPDWGLISAVLSDLHLPQPDWLGNPAWARVTIVLADAWQYTPFVILVLYAGMNNVDQSTIEAAEIDGAGAGRLLYSIILPAIRPLLAFVVIIRFMDAVRFFDQIFVLTAGGPGSATETLTMYTYSLAFRLLEVGKASALGMLTLLLLLFFTIFIRRALQSTRSGAAS